MRHYNNHMNLAKSVSDNTSSNNRVSKISSFKRLKQFIGFRNSNANRHESLYEDIDNNQPKASASSREPEYDDVAAVHLHGSANKEEILYQLGKWMKASTQLLTALDEKMVNLKHETTALKHEITEINKKFDALLSERNNPTSQSESESDLSQFHARVLAQYPATLFHSQEGLKPEAKPKRDVRLRAYAC